MQIKLTNGFVFDNEAMVSIKNEGDIKIIKMSNGQLVELPELTYHWIMKISKGHMIEINPELAVNIHNIICMVPTQDGYSISFDIEPPAEITSEQYEALTNQDDEKGTIFFTVMDLEKRIEMLLSVGEKCDDYNKL